MDRALVLSTNLLSKYLPVSELLRPAISKPSVTMDNSQTEDKLQSRSQNCHMRALYLDLILFIPFVRVPSPFHGHTEATFKAAP
jgi:hypothetical protein